MFRRCPRAPQAEEAGSDAGRLVRPRAALDACGLFAASDRPGSLKSRALGIPVFGVILSFAPSDQHCWDREAHPAPWPHSPNAPLRPLQVEAARAAAEAASRRINVLRQERASSAAAAEQVGWRQGFGNDTAPSRACDPLAHSCYQRVSALRIVRGGCCSGHQAAGQARGPGGATGAGAAGQGRAAEECPCGYTIYMC